MKIKTVLLFWCLILAFQGHTQKKKDKYLFGSSTINYYPSVVDYSFFTSYDRNQGGINLTFITLDSGTFVIEESGPIQVDLTTTSQPSVRTFSLGASFQIRGPNSTFSEFSLTRFSGSKSTYTEEYTYIYDTGQENTFREGYEDRSFVISLRYEYGKVFGRTRNKVRFGLSAVLEPGYLHYSRIPASTLSFPIKANIFSLNLGIAPILSFQLSKKVFLDFKVIPSFLIADFGSTRIANPILPLSLQKGNRNYELPEIDVNGTVQLRYLFKEPKKRRRRSKDSE